MGNTDPRTKLALVTAVFISVLGSSTWLGLGLALTGLLLWGILARVTLKTVLKALAALWLLFVFTLLMHAILSPGTPLLNLWSLSITYEGVARGLWMAARLVILVAGATVLTQTTSPLELTQALEYVLAPLRFFRIPIREAAMIVGIGIRFVPVLASEAKRIQEAQVLRGHSVRRGALLERIRSLVPILIPLMGGSLRRAEELGDAMAARAYRPGARRTFLYPLRFHALDYAIIVGSLAASLSVALWL